MARPPLLTRRECPACNLSSYQRFNHFNGVAHCLSYAWAQADISFIRSQCLGLATNDTNVLEFRPHGARQRKDVRGVHRMTVEGSYVRQLAQVRFDNVDRSGIATAPHSVNNDGRVIAVHQSVREVKAADSEIGYAYVG